jgi:hypothetical protein
MKRSNLTGLLVIVIVILVAGVGYTYLSSTGKIGNGTGGTIVKDSGSNISDYSAVFLTNGQVYFGKLYTRTGTVLDLRDIYYLQVNQTVQPSQTTSATATPTPSPQVSLVKLGNELHGPNDRMLIDQNQVLFTESLKDDSKVVQAINNYKAS